jgi:hypothetical protein
MLYALFQLWKMWTVSNSGWRSRTISIMVSTSSSSRSFLRLSISVQRNMTSGPRKPPRSRASEKLSMLPSDAPPGATAAAPEAPPTWPKEAARTCMFIAHCRVSAAATRQTTSTPTITTRVRRSRVA